MPQIPKLAPEVEIPRPRSSGVAVVAVAALAMFTAVGASAFVVRARLVTAPCGGLAVQPVAEPPIVASRLDFPVRAFITAVTREDDRAALELYRLIPAGADPAGRLASYRDVVLARQMTVLESEVLAGDCDAVRRHVAWLREVAPEENLNVYVDTSACIKRRYIAVELAD
jgi:hypothetical protein